MYSQVTCLKSVNRKTGRNAHTCWNKSTGDEKSYDPPPSLQALSSQYLAVKYDASGVAVITNGNFHSDWFCSWNGKGPQTPSPVVRLRLLCATLLWYVKTNVYVCVPLYCADVREIYCLILKTTTFNSGYLFVTANLKGKKVNERLLLCVFALCKWIIFFFIHDFSGESTEKVVCVMDRATVSEPSCRVLPGGFKRQTRVFICAITVWIRACVACFNFTCGCCSELNGSTINLRLKDFFLLCLLQRPNAQRRLYFPHKLRSACCLFLCCICVLYRKMTKSLF